MCSFVIDKMCGGVYNGIFGASTAENAPLAYNLIVHNLIGQEKGAGEQFPRQRGKNEYSIINALEGT